MFEGLTGFAAVTFIFGWPVIGMVLRHQRQVMEMKLRMSQQADQGLLNEIQEIKRQMSELRDTTTRYDLSFDAALQRIESRVGHVEQRLTTVERGQTMERGQTVEVQAVELNRA